MPTADRQVVKWYTDVSHHDIPRHLSPQERNASKLQFPGKGVWATLPDSMKGVGKLRDRLSMLLFKHMEAELPKLKIELESMIHDTSLDIERMGRSRSSLADQRLYLAEIVTTAGQLINMGCRGDYDQKFFGAIDIEASVVDHGNLRRLRAVVQSLNMRFAEEIRLNGRKYGVRQEGETTNKESSEDEGSIEDESSITDGDCLQPVVARKTSQTQIIRRVIKTGA